MGLRWLDRLEEALLALTMAGVVLINFANILARYLFHAAIAPSEELMVYLFVWMSFLGIGAAVRRRSHLGLSAFTDGLPPSARRAVALAVAALAILFFLVVGVKGVQMVLGELRYRQTTPALGYPEWVFGLAVPVSSALVVLRLLQNALADWRGGGAP